MNRGMFNFRGPFLTGMALSFNLAASAQVVLPDGFLGRLPNNILNEDLLNPAVQWITLSDSINLKAAYDEDKGLNTRYEVPAGYFFCGYKITEISASRSLYNVTEIDGKGFRHRATASGNKNDLNQLRAWLELRIEYRGFKLTGPDTVPPVCDQGGWRTTPLHINKVPPRVVAECSFGRLICTVDERDGLGNRIGRSEVCGVCPPSVPIP